MINLRKKYCKYYFLSIVPFKGGAAAKMMHSMGALQTFCMCDTCLGARWEAWTGTLLHMCCPSAVDAERCSARMQCMLCERTPAVIGDKATEKWFDIWIAWVLSLNANWFVDWDHYCSHLKGSHPDYLITVVEEVGQNIKNGCFWKDQFLKKHEHDEHIINLYCIT